MENKTKEQLAEEFYPPITNDFICSPKLVRDGFIAGYDARQNEIDALTPKWISVEERLPTERVEAVLLFNANAPKYNQCVYAGTWFLQENKFTSDSKFNLMGTVTHWMPLPNPPKQTKP